MKSSQPQSAGKDANRLFLVCCENPHGPARLIKTLVSNAAFDRGSLSPTYVKAFDVFAKRSKTGDWLLRLDSNQQPSG